jgi:predicted dehydrogenase
MRSVGVGVIGYGFIGKVHAFAYRNIPFFYDPAPLAVRLVGVATSRRETAEAARAHGGFETATDDWRELVARKDIDIINICTPNSLHVEQILAAIAAGKHVYCDKPLTVNVHEAAAVKRALAGWKGVGQMTFQYRFYSASQKARQLVEQGFIGTPIGFRGVYLHSGSVDPSVPVKWRQRKSFGGGVLRDIGSHLLDLADWLAGPIESIHAETRVLHPRRPDGRGGMEAVEVEDQVVMTVRCAGGAVGTLEASKIATGAEDDLRLEVNGDKGAIRLDLMNPDFVEAYSLADPDSPLGGSRGWKRIATLGRFPPPAAFPPPRSTSGWLRGHVHCLHGFLQAVAEGRPADPSLERGIAVQRMIDCAERSAASRTWEKVE